MWEQSEANIDSLLSGQGERTFSSIKSDFLDLDFGYLDNEVKNHFLFDQTGPYQYPIPSLYCYMPLYYPPFANYSISSNYPF
ncbi:hypothetical protein [Saliterribacillus persicus]|uniref:Uncharacterized protein n=1 Tax=Saliterribacillus persicus TaxID=930114 RepID=A0A368X6W6_9BACI|nr:hypothetical protein [Saliterribacillus persicus]RCW63742.1 hypothetical protein DFR57_11621 [Saliterribacillus persicus]